MKVTLFFGMNPFGHIEAMKEIFFSKCSKFYLNFENAIKPRENVDRFQDHWV